MANPWDNDEIVVPATGPRGLLQPGNIDLNNRPRVRNPDGSISTVRSMSANFDGREVLLPTVSDDGRLLSDSEAIDLYRRTGRNLGTFDSPASATAYAEQLHRDQERQYVGARNPWDDDEIVGGFGGVTSKVDSTERIVDLPPVRAVIAPEDQGFDYRKLPYVLRPSQMQGGTLGDFVGGHASDAGRSVRSALRGLGGVLDFVGEPIAAGIDYLTAPEPTLGDLVTGQAPARTLPRQLRFRELGDMAADFVGLPAPETAGQRVMDDVGQAIAGTAATLGVGGALNAGRSAASSPTLANRVGEVLGSQPALQTVSAATGAAAAGATREAGGGTGAQVLAGVLGGLAPGVGTAFIPRVPTTGLIPQAAQQGVRRVVRGGASADDVAMARDQFAAGGTTPSVGQATGNRIMQGLETFLGSVPGGAGRMADFAQRQAGQVGARMDELAAGLTPRGGTVTPTQVGTAIREGLTGAGEDSLASRAKAMSDRLYGRVDAAIPDDTRVEVTGTRAALADLNSIIEGAPSVSRFFQNAKLQGIEAGLTRDMEGVDAVLSRPGMEANAEAYRQFLKEGAAAATERNLKRKQLGIFGGEEKVPTDAEIEADIAATLGNMADGQLPYEALRKLRTLVGGEISDFSLSSDVPRSKWKALYGALSNDMRAAMEGNPKAIESWERANKFHTRRVERMEALDHVLDKSGGPEAVYKAAFGNTKDGATTLRTVMRSLPQDARREMSASFVRRMGRAVGSQQDNESGVFSMESFLTNWANMSPEAKKELFGYFGNDYRANMEKIAAMASKVRDGSKVFKNPSGTAQRDALITQIVGTASTAGTALGAGNASLAAMIVLGSVGSSVIGNRGAALMTNPRFVKWLAANESRPTGELVAQINVLSRIGRNNDDQEITEAAEAMKRAIEESQQASQ